MRTTDLRARRTTNAVLIYLIILVSFQVFLITVAVEIQADRVEAAVAGVEVAGRVLAGYRGVLGVERLEADGIPVAHVYGWVDDPRAFVIDVVPGENNFDASTDEQRVAVMDEYMGILARVHALGLLSFDGDTIVIPAPVFLEVGTRQLHAQFAATENHLIRTPGGYREAGELMAEQRRRAKADAAAEVENLTVGHDDTAEDSVSILPALLGKAKAPLREAIVHHSVNGSFAIRRRPSATTSDATSSSRRFRCTRTLPSRATRAGRSRQSPTKRRRRSPVPTGL